MTAGQPFRVTFFGASAAGTKSEAVHTLESLSALITRTTAASKPALPWLKLARFGDRRTSKGSLRHDANVLAITGIEADYDGGAVEMSDAVARLEQQGVTAIVYTSPSHTEDAPRWRVLCPLAEEVPPAKRSHYLGRLNGLLGGIFAGESWAMSQAYYFGSVRNNPSHRVEVIDGIPIDGHDDLDEVVIGRPGAAKAAGPDQIAGKDAREDAELVARIITGEGFHTELTALAARYTARGIPPATVCELLRGLMLSHPEGTRDERWHDRYADIDRTVQTALTKYQADKRRPLARLAFQLIRARRPGDEVRDAVLHQAAALGVAEPIALDIIIWAGRQELARRAGHDV